MAAWWMTVAIPDSGHLDSADGAVPGVGNPPQRSNGGQLRQQQHLLVSRWVHPGPGNPALVLHRRIALHIVHVVGTNPARMVLGFMLATAFLSMWISNTATALMMLPIALAVIASMREVAGGKSMGGFAPALLLGIAYSASIGGLATPIGTPPNISFLRILGDSLSRRRQPSHLAAGLSPFYPS